MAHEGPNQDSNSDESSDHSSSTPLSRKRKTSQVTCDDDVNLDCQDLLSKHRLFKPAKFIKTEDDKVPLPDPFELPRNYRPDVVQALESKKMTLGTTSSFLSAIAGSMFTYKRYPTNEDYVNVARVIVQKYPFMKSPTGKPYVSSILCIPFNPSYLLQV